MKKLLIALGILTLPIIGMGADYATQPIGPFSGLNNTDNPLIIPAEMAQDLLNVEISPGGRSIRKRKGISEAFQTAYTTSPTHGAHIFFNSDGTDVALVANDRQVSASVGGTSPVVIISSATFGATLQCVDSQGYAYCVNSARDWMLQTDGASDNTYITKTDTGTIVAITIERLVMAGFANAPNRIDFSAANDFTSWTVGGDPTDPIQFTITAPGAKVTHLTYAHDRVYWFKDSSFGYILEGATHLDWVAQIVSPNVGTNDNTSAFWNGVLYFRGQDSHIYAYDGANLVKLTRDQTTTVNASQTRIANAWTQTSQSDFESGSSSSTLDLTTVSGSIILSTANPIDSFVDTSSANFAEGTLVSVSTIIIDGSIVISTETSQANLYESGTFNCATFSSYCRQYFTANPQVVTQIQLYPSVDNPNDDQTIYLREDDSGSIGDILGTAILTVSGTGSWQSATFDTPVQLASGTAYWIDLPQVSDGDAFTICAPTHETCNDVPADSAIVTIAGPNSGYSFKFRLDGWVHESTGDIVSQSFDVGHTTSDWVFEWAKLTGDETLNSETISYETQTASDTSGSWETLTSVTNGEAPSSTPQQYIRYKALLETADISTSPVLNSVTIDMSSRTRTTGTYSSAVHNAPNLTSWDVASFTEDLNDGTIAYSARSSTDEFTVDSATPTWTSITNGDVLTISTGTYFQARASFTVTASTQAPELQSFTFNWFEGKASDKAYGHYFDDAIWFSITSGDGATDNNLIMRYDLINKATVLYDIPSNGFYSRNKSLYIASASSGTVFKYGDVDNDNGEPINAYWESKDFFSLSPFIENDYRNLSISAGSVAGSSVTVTYTVDGSSSTSVTVPLYTANSSFTKNNRNLPLGKTGSTFSVKVGNNASNQFFEIFGIQFGYRPKEWRPTQ